MIFTIIIKLADFNLTSEGLANVDVDKLPPHWKHHAGVEPSRYMQSS